MVFRIIIYTLLLFSLLLPQNIISVTNLKNGMQLSGITRMENNTKKIFKLKIISILRNVNPKNSQIMAEILDSDIYESGVLLGMSGSPVYYNEQLVGAIGYTTTFLKKPIVIITPIESMLRITNYPGKSKNNSQKPLNNRNYPSGMAPIQTPLSANGILPQTLELYKKYFNANNFYIIPGASMQAKPAQSAQPVKKNKLEEKENITKTFLPGDACAVNFVSGDIDITAIGTVTYVSNDLILAMGHTMGLGGSLKLPLCKARIDTVVPRLDISYKVGTRGEEVGAIIEDRYPGVLGKIGEKAGRIPLEINLDTEIQKNNFKYYVIDDENHFSSLAAMLIINTIMSYESLAEKTLLEFKITINTDYKSKSITLIDYFNGINQIEAINGVISSFLSLIDYLRFNQFKNIKITDVKIDLNLSNKIKFYTIRNIEINKRIFQPGDNINIKINLEQYKDEDLIKTINFTIPNDTKDGTYGLNISSGYFWLFVDTMFSPAKYIPDDIDEAFDLLNMEINNKILSAWIVMNRNGLVINGTEYKSIPLSYSSIFEKSRNSQKNTLYSFLKKDIQLDTIIDGYQTINIIVKRNLYE